MIKKCSLTMLMALMVLMVVVSGCTEKNNTTNTTTSISNQTSPNTNNNNSNIISAEEAKTIAQGFVEEPGVTAETPTLTTVDGRQIYVVPLYQNGNIVGEIEIDAVTGENIGGAGGAP
ncbi:MAG: PepSY domain-containing protein [Euryarchaeota archaeon]|nr:PepSY domain-containing protein [Euryarchaeota archaeon]HHT19493.1 PepSY domain-containing protein [Methanobacterium sp.]